MTKKNNLQFLKTQACALGFFFIFSFIYSALSLNWIGMGVFICFSTFIVFDKDVKNLLISNRDFRIYTMYLTILCLFTALIGEWFKIESKLVFSLFAIVSFIYYRLLTKYLSHQ